MAHAQLISFSYTKGSDALFVQAIVDDAVQVLPATTGHLGYHTIWTDRNDMGTSINGVGAYNGQSVWYGRVNRNRSQ